VNGVSLRAAGLADLCVDTGFAAGRLLSPARMGEVAGARAHEIVRLEQVAEEVAAEGPSAGEFADAVRARLSERSAHAAGVKWDTVRPEEPDELAGSEPVAPGPCSPRRGGPATLDRGKRPTDDAVPYASRSPPSRRSCAPPVNRCWW
jgi:hypothetical protein